MAEPLSATSLVVLALLSCLAARNVEAQDGWRIPGSKGAPPAYPQPIPQPEKWIYPEKPQPGPPEYPQQPDTPDTKPRPPEYPQQPDTPFPRPRPPVFPQQPDTPFPQQPDTPYPKPRPPVFPQQPDTPFPKPRPPVYPQQPDTPFPKPRPPVYPQQPDTTFPKPRPPVYPQTPDTPFPQQPDTPYPKPRPPVFPQQPDTPFPKPRPPVYPQTPDTPFPQQPDTPFPKPRPPVFPQQPDTPFMKPRPPVYPQTPDTPFPQQPDTPFPKPRPPGFPKQPPPQTSDPIYYDQSSKGPKNPQPQKPHPLLPKDPNDLSCEVDRNVRIPCGSPQISAAECETMNCCFDGQHCFFGKAVTIQCTKDAQFIVVVARDATLPNIDLESISMMMGGQGCTQADSNSAFAIYQFPVTSCGSVVMEEPGVIIYQNQMSSSFETLRGERGLITRDSHFQLIFQCKFIGTHVETLVIEVLPLQEPPLPVAALGPIRVEMRLANGQCLSKGCNEVDAAYGSFYLEADYPVTKVLRDPVYVEVRLLGKTDPNLVLTLGHCWTTTKPNPHSLPQWDILIDGCPYRDDRYLSSLVPVGPSSGLDFPSHYRRFIFKMFTFVDTSTMLPMREMVYIHCSTSVCSASSGHSCEPSCYRNKRDVESTHQVRNEPMVVVSSGPVNMNVPPKTAQD